MDSHSLYHNVTSEKLSFFFGSQFCSSILTIEYNRTMYNCMICNCFKFEYNRLEAGEIMTFLPWKTGRILALYWRRVNLLINYWAKLHIIFKSVFPCTCIFTDLKDAKTSLFHNINTVLNLTICHFQKACCVQCVMKLEISH